jgi:hypothetical protein
MPAGSSRVLNQKLKCSIASLVNAFSVGSVLSLNPGLKQPWAEFSERLRRIFKLNQYLFALAIDIRAHQA